MKPTQSDRPSAQNYEIISDGPVACVRLSPAVAKIVKDACAGNDELSKKRRVQLERYFKEFSENNPPRLSDQMLKKEGSFGDGQGGQGKVAILAFKPWKLRIYGSILTVDGKRCFIGTEVDPSKKQDRANRDLLESAAIEIGKLAEYDGAKAGGRDDRARGRKT